MDSVNFNDLDDHQLFDPLHDFGKFSTCYDTLTKNRSDTKCGIGKMMFTFLTMYSHSGGKNDTFLQKYSNFTSFLGKIPSQLQPSTLENTFMNNAVTTATATASGTFKIIIGSRTDLQGVAVCSQLEEFFNAFENNEKIYLIVDTQKNLYGCIASNKNYTKFTTVITRESIYDPANKVDIDQPTLWKTKFKTNAILIETGGGIRRYNSNSNGTEEKTFGKFDIELSNIFKVNGANNVNFTIYDKSTDTIIIPKKNCKLNSTPNHPNSIGFLNKEITKVMNPLKIERTCPSSVGNFYSQDKGFQNVVNANIGQNLINIKKLCGFFAQKRLGDALQAEVCLFSKKNPIICEDYNKKPQDVRNTILVTIDRMLFAYAILRNVPVIYDDGKKYHCYKPSGTPSFTGQISEASQLTSKATLSPEKFGGSDNKNQMQISQLSTKSNVIQGGLDEIDNLITDEIIEELFIEPLLFFYILPFTFKYWKSLIVTNKQYIIELQNKYEKILEEIVKTDIFTVRSSTNGNDNNCLLFTSEIIENNNNIRDKYIFFKKDAVSYLTCNVYNNIANPTIDFNLHTAINSKFYSLKKDNLRGLIRGFDDKDIRDIQKLYNFDKIDVAASDAAAASAAAADNNEGWSAVYDLTTLIAILTIVAFILRYLNINKITGGGGTENFKEFILQVREQLKDMPAPILTENLIQPINTTVLFSYLWMFRMYEVKVCFDDEQLKMDYDDCAPNLPGEYYVPTDKMPYFFFKRLIDDYEQQKDKVSYLFIERILYELDSSLYTRINEIKYLIMMDDFVDDDVMNNTMLYKMIEANGELYENTKNYVSQILGDITPNVNAFDRNIGVLYNYPQANYPNALFDYCTKKLGLNRYSFLYMYNDFTDNIFTQPIAPLQIKSGIDYAQEYPISPLEQPLQSPVMVGGHRALLATTKSGQGSKNLTTNSAGDRRSLRSEEEFGGQRPEDFGQRGGAPQQITTMSFGKKKRYTRKATNKRKREYKRKTGKK